MADDTQEIPNIRAYRARKLRPCDNCRTRRKRCVIPEQGRSCTLCVQTHKQCTFLHERQKPGRKSVTSNTSTITTPSRPTQQQVSPSESMSTVPSNNHAGPSNYMIRNNNVNNRSQQQIHYNDISPTNLSEPGHTYSSNVRTGSTPISASNYDSYPYWNQQPSSSSSNFYIPPTTARFAQSTSTNDLISNILHAKCQNTSSQTEYTRQQVQRKQGLVLALDDEAAEDEELYLVGTASERDALVLNNLAYDDTTSIHSRGFQDDHRLTPPSIPGIRIRKVSSTVSFVFYKSLPYGPESTGGYMNAWDRLEELIGPHIAHSIVLKFFEIEGQGLPIFPQGISNDIMKIPETLRCLCLTAGLIYTPSLRQYHQQAYLITTSFLRKQPPRARLWTLQFCIMDLNGREAINPSGNFIVLGLTVSIARLLGLHENPQDWNIPQWEKDLRINLWWALAVYDKLSCLTFGRQQTIQFSHSVPLPTIDSDSTPSFIAFRFLCELVTILGDLQSPTNQTCCNCTINESRFDNLSRIATRLDRWKQNIDNYNILNVLSASNGISPPGIKSLELIYLGSALIVVRDAWDNNQDQDNKETPRNDTIVEIACQRACLTACENIVNFVYHLSPDDLGGYWSSHSPFMLSFCLTLLIRVIIASDRTDQAVDAIWQAALFQLRRFISTMTNYMNEYQWDAARLATSRARYFIPLLTRHAAEFEIALLPLQENLDFPPPPDDHYLDQFLNSLVDTIGLDALLAGPAISQNV
ncbi:uncharacterized protein L201_003837 [Kwoniella dendrophila CBS 6074]|uniref:Zn(2)-C6 fungal-type domain-containing protein n=1 Tax=Kwoniella dendrophila CBS 6074 TaxID=1295534 RepID=A0AAX4JU72_9TREE